MSGSNPFDQFDAPPPPQPSGAAASSNPFDQFDEQPATHPQGDVETQRLYQELTPQQPQRTQGQDIQQGIAHGLVAGGAGIIGAPADLYRLARIGYKWLDTHGQELAGVISPEEGAAQRQTLGSAQEDPGTSAWIQKQVETIARNHGKDVSPPQTVPGQYAQTISSFLPAAAAVPFTGGESAATAAKQVPGALLRYGVLPAATSETAGQLTQGTALEPYARVAGALAPETVMQGAWRAINPAATSVTPVEAVSGSASYQVPRTSAEAKAIASDFYQRASSVGGELTPEFTNRFLDQAAQLAPQTTEGRMVRGDTPITGMISRMEALRDNPISLGGAQEIDEALGDMIDHEYGMKGLSKDGRNLLNLQGQFRDMIQNAGPEDTVAGNQGFLALKDGRGAWAQAAKMNDLERIQTRAELSDNPATAIRSGIRTLLSNPVRARGYAPQEISALKAAADRGIVGGAMHVFGSRLVPIVAGAAGFGSAGLPGMTVGALGADAATSLMRKGAAAIQERRLANAANTLGSRVPGVQPVSRGLPAVGRAALLGELGREGGSSDQDTTQQQP